MLLALMSVCMESDPLAIVCVCVCEERERMKHNHKSRMACTSEHSPTVFWCIQCYNLCNQYLLNEIRQFRTCIAKSYSLKNV
uniref:Secreted protein n=1 Tax=Rhizophora mucronata TaxID=61149 RepID=A0A2P2KH60_RHIMU